MREIKFRAWDKKQKQMFWWDVLWGNHYQGDGYIGMVPWDEKQTHHMHRDNIRLVDPDDCEIMQFTGLHDKQGREIYEGDVLQYTDNYNRPITGQVQYLGNGFWIEEKDETHYMPNDREVIGNIYENPELAGGTQKGQDLEG